MQYKKRIFRMTSQVKSPGDGGRIFQVRRQILKSRDPKFRGDRPIHSRVIRKKSHSSGLRDCKVYGVAISMTCTVHSCTVHATGVLVHLSSAANLLRGRPGLPPTAARPRSTRYPNNTVPIRERRRNPIKLQRLVLPGSELFRRAFPLLLTEAVIESRLPYNLQVSHCHR